MARQSPQTANLGLPLRVAGVVALQQTVKRGFELIDAAIAALQSGTGIRAEEIAYDGGDAGDSNSTATNVAAALDELYARVRAVEDRTDSNSQG